VTDYAALRWNRADAGAAHVADRIAVWLERQGWWHAIDAAGWRVLLDRRETGSLLRTCAHDRIVLIGRLFDRAATIFGRNPEQICPADPESFPTLAATLSAHGWGAYVAIGIDEADPDRTWIFRDPIGALECVTWCAQGVRIVSSTPEAILPAARPQDLGIDWARVADLLASPGSVGDDLPFTGLHAVPPGTVVECRSGARTETRVWHPAHFCSPLPATTQEPERRLAGLVDSCVATWCSDIRNGAAELSGGLDSAIVAAAASRAKPSPIHRWFHYSSDDIAGDERRYAQAVADHLGLPLTTRIRAARRLGLEDIETMPIAARPGSGAISLFHDRHLAAELDRLDVDAVLTGHGGDALFFQPTSPLVAADLWADGRSLAGKWAALIDIARWTKRSIWHVCATALRHGIHPSPLAFPAMMHRFLGEAARGARHRHPWLDGIAHLPPAKQLQIWMIANGRSVFGASWCAQGRRMIHPLMSQPLIEHVLAIPAIDLTSGRRERALARAAFAHRLPPTLIDRRGKGDLTLYFGRMLAGSTDFLRAYLLDGTLAAHQVIDRRALEAILTPDTLMAEDHYSELLTSLILERWARSWSERLGAGSTQGDATIPSQRVRAGSK
jgi:asparagine synthase (glutamine-hydrolysing)